MPFVTLPGVTLEAGETLTVQQIEDDRILSPIEFAVEPAVAPDPYVYARDTPFDAGVFVGTDESEILFEAAQGDLVQAGGGNDIIYSGSGSHFYPDEWNHDPGIFSTLQSGETTIDGGAGDDTLWFADDQTLIGGEGDDLFATVANPSGGSSSDPGLITDFQAGEDTLQVLAEMPSGADLTEITSQIQLTYDSTNDQTNLALFGDTVATLSGDKTGLTIAIIPDYGDFDPFNLVGDPITQAEYDTADIQIQSEATELLFGD